MHTVMHRDVDMDVPLPLSVAIGARRDDYYAALQPYQTYLGPADADGRSEAASAAIRYVSDAVAVACHYGGMVARVVAEMEQSWDELGLRSHSTGAAILAQMATMPAASSAYLADSTGQSPRAVRRALSHLVDKDVIAEAPAEGSNRKVFELPEILRIVDERHDLLSDCWELHMSGATDVVPEVLERFRGGSGAEGLSSSALGDTTQSPEQSPLVHSCGADTTAGGRCGHQVQQGTERCPAGHTPH